MRFGDRLQKEAGLTGAFLPAVRKLMTLPNLGREPSRDEPVVKVWGSACLFLCPGFLKFSLVLFLSFSLVPSLVLSFVLSFIVFFAVSFCLSLGACMSCHVFLLFFRSLGLSFVLSFSLWFFLSFFRSISCSFLRSLSVYFLYLSFSSIFVVVHYFHLGLLRSLLAIVF